jgi:putative hydrolase of the HAD superfamily
MITTVVFDLDDTLYDEVEYCKSGFAAVAQFLADSPGVPAAEQIFDAFWNQFAAGNHTKTFNVALYQLGISYDDKLIEELVKVYRNHTPKITLPQDSRDILNQLSSKYTLALLTDGFLPAQKLKVQALGIEKYFKCIIYTEELGRQFWKPSPVGFERLLQTLNVKPQNVAYVADNPAKDFIAPNKMGFLTVQINRPARIHTESAAEPVAAAKYVIHQLTQLPPLLDRF